MKHSYDDDIDEDLNQFCEDMESELRAISGGGGLEPEHKTPSRDKNESKNTKKSNEKILPNKTEKSEKTTTVSTSPWGMSLFSSFASSATKSLSSSFSPLAKDMSSISALASSATKAFSDTITGAPSSSTPPKRDQSYGKDDLTALAQSPEALEKLRRIQAEHDAQRSEMTYACLIASRSAREVAVPARSVTEIPCTVPPGKEISWKFQVKQYDILFGVKLRVQKDDGSGEWSEHVLVPLDRITSEDHIDESCCSERCTRKFIFTLDNNIAMLYSKTVAFDIIMTDDRDWKQEQQEEEQQQYESHQQQHQPFYEQQHQITDNDGEYVTDDNNNQSTLTPTRMSADQHVEDSVDEGYDQSHLNEYFPPPEEEWSMHHDDEGQVYFYNNITNESQWDPPPDFVFSDDQHEDTEVEEVVEDEADAMAALMHKLSMGFKAGHVTAEQRQKFMADIIECRDLGEMHRELNAIFDQCAGNETNQQGSATIV